MSSTVFNSFVPDTTYVSQEPAQQHEVCREIPLVNLLSSLLVHYRVSDADDTARFTGLQLQLAHFLENNPHETASMYRMRPRFTPSRKVDEDGRVKAFQQGRTDGAGRYPGDLFFKDENRVSLQIHNLNLRDENDSIIAENVPLISIWVPESMGTDWLVQNQAEDE